MLCLFDVCLQLAFGVKWQHYELWSGTVNLSSLAILNEDDDDDPNKPSPFVLVKCHSPDMVGIPLCTCLRKNSLC